MVEKLRGAVEALELETALSVIEEIGKQNRPLADSLRLLAKEYRFDRLQGLLNPA
ncbi:MAG: hypothetical protein ACWGSD_10860 [Thermodesulfobacteriota bacterium]